MIWPFSKDRCLRFTVCVRYQRWGSERTHRSYHQVHAADFQDAADIVLHAYGYNLTGSDYREAKVLWVQRINP